MATHLEVGDALLIVDVQNDFVPGGALAVPEGDAVIPVLNEWMAAAREAGLPVYASRDWHPPNHISFKAQGGLWPSHCVQNTRGAAFHPDLDFHEDVTVVTKGDHPDKEAYSAFDGTDLAERLRHAGVERLWVGGLATDYCVRASALDAAQAGFETHVVLPASRGITEETTAQALADLRDAGVIVEDDESSTA